MLVSCIMLVISVDALLVKLTVVTALSGHSGLSIEAGEFERDVGARFWPIIWHIIILKKTKNKLPGPFWPSARPPLSPWGTASAVVRDSETHVPDLLSSLDCHPNSLAPSELVGEHLSETGRVDAFAGGGVWLELLFEARERLATGDKARACALRFKGSTCR